MKRYNILTSVAFVCIFCFSSVSSATEADPTVSEYGTYPNCIAPAVPIESQSWWGEVAFPDPECNDPNYDGPGNCVPGADDPSKLSGFRHVHMGICAPNARANSNGGGVVATGVHDLVAVVIMHNNPGELNWVGMRTDPVHTQTNGIHVRDYDHNNPDNIDWSTQSSTCTGGHHTCVKFDPPLFCQDRKTCKFEVPMRFNFDNCTTGVCELRTRPNLSEIPERNDRQFTTNNAQVYTGGTGNYRSKPHPIARGWYTGLDYANARIENYMDLFNGRTDISVPIVSGQVDLEIAHRQTQDGQSVRSVLRLDPGAHTNNPGSILYDRTGQWDGTYSLDTTDFSDGRHALFLATHESNEFGESVGILRLFIDFQNGVLDPVCGNDQKEAGEDCDGSDLNNQSCESLGFDGGTLQCNNCLFDTINCIDVPPPVCGDGNVDAGEECDDGNTSNGDGCDSQCRIEVPAPVCGDGNVDAGEECDDGNTSNGDGCDSQCRIELPPAPVCGDGNVDTGEECDDGNTSNGDGCDSQCRIELPPDPVCGDGNVDSGEECDDGNTSNGDGCDTQCRIEVPPNPGPELPVVNVTASNGNNNSAAKTIDNDLNTRWSGNGDGVWISYELDANHNVDKVDIAWYKGDVRAYNFDIEVSIDNINWTEVFSGSSSGNTLNHETYNFSTSQARYLRIVGHGNTSNSWFGITEVNIYSNFNIPQVNPDPACGDGNVDSGEECDDGNTSNGDGCDSQCRVELPNDPVCGDGNVDSGEECDDGNTINGDGCDSACRTEVPPNPGTELSVVKVTASNGYNSSAAKTIDNDLSTRWSGNGDGVWISYELDANHSVDKVDIAWFKGDVRAYDFDIEVSTDNIIWTKVFSGSSSGHTLNHETYNFSTSQARYLRIVGHGNTSNSWFGITEVDI